jgi:hypothetical protein
MNRFDLCPERLQATGDEIRQAGKPFEVAAPGLDGDQIFQGVKQGRLLTLRGREHRFLGLRPNRWREWK